jgi:hypothetical protein
MSHRSLGGLIVLNAVLLATLGLLTLGPSTAEAQLGGRRAGDYIMVAARTTGRPNATVYITDLNNAAMMAVTYDVNKKSINPVAARDIGPDFQAAPNR